ncbi:MAG: lysylphosphatidylglycerol synthase transmembrane domain-containing protein [Xanthobacteraceae bacterium]
MQNESIGRTFLRRIPYRALSLVASAILLAVGSAVVYQRVNWREIAAVWRNLDLALFALACIVYWLQFPLNSVRLQRVVLWASGRSPHDIPSLGFLFRVTCSSGFVAAAAPVGFAGDAAKIAALRLFGSLSVTEATRCALFDRVVGVQWLCLIGLATLPFQAAAGFSTAIILPQLAIFIAPIIGVGVLLALPRVLARVRGELIERIARVFAGYRSILRPSRSAIQGVIMLLNVVLAGGALYLLFLAAGSHVSAWLVAAFIPLLQLVNGLPFLYLGLGGREIAMASTLGVVGGLTMNETLAISIAWGVILITTGVVNGVFLIGDWHSTVPSADDGRTDRVT